MSIADLEKGQKAQIIGYTDGCAHLRMMEMGFLPGEILQIIQIAPLGGPMAIGISGYVLSLRREEAKTVLVHPAL